MKHSSTCELGAYLDRGGRTPPPPNRGKKLGKGGGGGEKEKGEKGRKEKKGEEKMREKEGSLLKGVQLFRKISMFSWIKSSIFRKRGRISTKRGLF